MEDRTCSALLTLAKNANNDHAQAARYDQNKAAIDAGMHHWLNGPYQDCVTNTVILRIAKRGCYYYQYEDAKAWVVGCADLECLRLKDEMERGSRNHGRAAVGFEAESRQPHG